MKTPNDLASTYVARVSDLNYSGIEFPATVKQISKIEKQNYINVNVFGYGLSGVYPIYISKGTYNDHMDVLLLADNSFGLIKDSNRFMFNQIKHLKRSFTVKGVFNVCRLRIL